MQNYRIGARRYPFVEGRRQAEFQPRTMTKACIVTYRVPVFESSAMEKSPAIGSCYFRQAVLSLFALLLGVAGASPPARSENWPEWRGSLGNGNAAAASFPLHWDTKKNIAWSVKLPGPGSSTPIVWEDNIFLTCESGAENSLLCLSDRGEMRWSRSAGSYREAKHRKASGANPSAVTDGQYVAAYFKSGELACFDFSGNPRWRTNLQQRFAADTLWWDLGTSPVLVDQKLIVACMQSGESYLVAFDLATGDVVWKVDRNLPAPDESTHSYTTPIVVEAGAEKQLVVLGADHITGHAVRDGSEIWRVGGLNPSQASNFRLIASPVCDTQCVYACYARGGAILAARRDGRGDVTASHVLWTLNGNFADVPSPTLDERHVYVCSDQGEVHCIDKRQGEIRWTRPLKKSRAGYSASPIRAGTRLYVTSETGTTSVLDLADEGRVLAENDLDEPTVATPVLIDGMILIRTQNRLWCVRDDRQE